MNSSYMIGKLSIDGLIAIDNPAGVTHRPVGVEPKELTM